ncbi:hypothetical protein [Streptomyces sp. DT195]|uniref:hypothetical protein n=1 Tax=Streptomyces sp. DT195 TaxID=3393419 RepID=UPI003CE90944
MDRFEQARALLNAVIGAYSGRIGKAESRAAVQALRAERTPLIEERERLTPGDHGRVTEILQEMPDRLRVVRAGGTLE